MLKKTFVGVTVGLVLISMFFVDWNQGFAQSPDIRIQEGSVDDEIQKETPKPSIDFINFELEIELNDNTELEWEYTRKKKKVTAEIERGKEEITGAEAIKEMEMILSKLNITDEMDDEAIVAHVLEVVAVSSKDVKKLELEYKCESGKKVRIKQ